MFNISAFFKKDSSRTKIHFDPETRRMATGAFYEGKKLYDRSVKELDQLDADYGAQVAAGGLTPEMEAEFERSRGEITDMVARSKRGWGADLMQAARRGGGTMDANTALAFQLEREGELDEAAFGAQNDISFEKASARMRRTDALMQQILAIRARKTDLSQEERNRAANMWLNSQSGSTTHGRSYGASASYGTGGGGAAAGGW